MLHVFGVGHNDHIAAASTNRPHGLAPVSLIVHSGKNWLDVIGGYGEGLVKHHHFNYELLAGEVVVVVSDSGTDRMSIEVCQEAQNHGAFVAAVTGVSYSKARKPPEGMPRLFEKADFVLDNLHPEKGDWAFEIEGKSLFLGSYTHQANSMLLTQLQLEAVEFMLGRNYPVPLWLEPTSAAFDARNHELSLRYKHRLSRHP